MTLLFTFVNVLAQVLTFAIFLRAILSWLPVGGAISPLRDIIQQATDPILTPLRQIIPTIGSIDITPIIAILLLQTIARISINATIS